jgi:hypothetical protein
VIRRAALAMSALALVGACSGARAGGQVAGPVAAAVPPGDLPPAVPPSDAMGDHAETGTPARVVLGARRDRANEAFLQFMRAIGRRDLAALGTMLDATVYDLDSGETYPRETWISDLDAMLSRVYPSQVLAAVPTMRVVVRSAAEMRRQGRTFRFNVGSDDWFVESALRVASPTLATAQLPRVVMVRFLGDEPVIEGFVQSRTRYR